MGFKARAGTSCRAHPPRPRDQQGARPPGATQWVLCSPWGCSPLGVPSPRAPAQRHTAWGRGHVMGCRCVRFCSRQRSEHRPPLSQVALRSARNPGHRGLPPCPARGVPAVPWGLQGGEQPAAPRGGCTLCWDATAIAQGCHPPQKTPLVGKMGAGVCTPGCRRALSSEPEHLCLSPGGSPGLGQVPSGLACPRQGVTAGSPAPAPASPRGCVRGSVPTRQGTGVTHWAETASP